MNVEEAKRVVADQKDVVEEKLSRNYIERDVPPDVSRYLAVPNILAILGVRRSGKSTLSLLLMKRFNAKFAYLNFDDERLYGITARDLRNLEQAIYEVYGNVDYLVLDEVHNVEGWELFASRLRETKRVIVTGSNSRILSGELATALTGRHSDLVLFPFSFKEYLRFKGMSEEVPLSTRRIAEVKVELERYLQEGGFPEALMVGKDQVDVIYNDILFKDVIFRYRVREMGKFKDFAKSIVSYYSTEVSLSRLSKTLSVDKKTVDQWAFGLESAYLVYFLPRYGEKPRERLTFNKKVYVVDPGLISRVAVRAKDMGRVIENVVFVKLARENQLKGLYYVKGNGFEVEFYDEVNSRLVQVTYAHDKVEEREIRGLLKAKELVEAKEMIVVTYDVEGVEEVEGEKIRLVPLYEFLLS